MKKLIFVTLLLTSKTLAGGLFHGLGLGYCKFPTYEFTTKSEMKNFMTNRALNFKWEPLLIKIMKKNIKVHLNFSIGFTSRNFTLTLDDSFNSKIDTGIRNNNEKEWYIWTNEELTEDDKEIAIYKTHKGIDKTMEIYNIKYYNKNKNLKEKKVFIEEPNKNGSEEYRRYAITSYPYCSSHLSLPFSGGLSIKIKIHKKTYISIGLNGYINFIAWMGYKTIYLPFSNITKMQQNAIYGCKKHIKDNCRQTEDILQEIIHYVNGTCRNAENYSIYDLFCIEIEASPLFYKIIDRICMPYIDMHANSKLFAYYYYGGLFNISISSRIYKHLELKLSLSLEYIYNAKKVIINDSKHLFLLHPFSIEILIVV